MHEPVVVPKREIAREFLDAAIEFYLAGTNLICAVHLASAAEELLGGYLEEESPNDPEKQRISTFAWKAEKALKTKPGVAISDAEARKSVSCWKNQIKHMKNRDDAMATFEYGLMAAAEFHIGLALSNFYKLDLPETTAIQKFEENQCRKLRRDGAAPGYGIRTRAVCRENGRPRVGQSVACPAPCSRATARSRSLKLSSLSADLAPQPVTANHAGGRVRSRQRRNFLNGRR